MNTDPIWGKLLAVAITATVSAVIAYQYAKIRILKRRLKEFEMEIEILWK